MAQSQKYAERIGWGITAYWKCKLSGQQCARESWSNRKPMCKGCFVEKRRRKETNAVHKKR